MTSCWMLSLNEVSRSHPTSGPRWLRLAPGLRQISIGSGQAENFDGMRDFCGRGASERVAKKEATARLADTRGDGPSKLGGDGKPTELPPNR